MLCDDDFVCDRRRYPSYHTLAFHVPCVPYWTWTTGCGCEQEKTVIHFVSQSNREGANDGFHEAIGELMSMCVSTPKHLYNIGLLDRLLQDNETTINFLFQKALTSISTLPFHYIQDLWRWKAFRGDYPDETMWNDEYWKLSEELVGIHPPIPRTSEDLDCPSLFHIAQDADMVRYFVRTILQFQFAESLCKAAGQEGPVYECDFGGSTKAGERLAAMLQLGASKPWPDALETLTGGRTMDTTAMRKYFEPLEKWLKATNKANGDTPGWTVKGLYKAKVDS
ncbi:unnamed protein product [Orchesella dallaii]|uniref:Angiotensin-converting enzyme n=1 Tax=Orchesella dallaii TaxID=48710 RepID=A0ABP1QWF5_9HEXA